MHDGLSYPWFDVNALTGDHLPMHVDLNLTLDMAINYLVSFNLA